MHSVHAMYWKLSRYGREKHFPCNFQFNNNINSAKYTEAHTHAPSRIQSTAYMHMCGTVHHSTNKITCVWTTAIGKTCTSKTEQEFMAFKCAQYSMTDSKPLKNRDNFNLLYLCHNHKVSTQFIAMRFVFRFSHSLSHLCVRSAYFSSYTRIDLCDEYKTIRKHIICYKLMMSLRLHSH